MLARLRQRIGCSISCCSSATAPSSFPAPAPSAAPVAALSVTLSAVPLWAADCNISGAACRAIRPMKTTTSALSPAPPLLGFAISTALTVTLSHYCVSTSTVVNVSIVVVPISGFRHHHNRRRCEQCRAHRLPPHYRAINCAVSTVVCSSKCYRFALGNTDCHVIGNTICSAVASAAPTAAPSATLPTRQPTAPATATSKPASAAPSSSAPSLSSIPAAPSASPSNAHNAAPPTRCPECCASLARIAYLTRIVARAASCVLE